MLFPSVSRLAGARPAFGSAKRFAFLQLFFVRAIIGRGRIALGLTKRSIVFRLLRKFRQRCVRLGLSSAGPSDIAPRQSRPFAVGSSAADCTRCRPRIPAAGDERRSRSATDCKNALPLSSRLGRVWTKTVLASCRSESLPLPRRGAASNSGFYPGCTRSAGTAPLPFAGMLSLSGNCRPMSGLRAVCRESSGR